MKFITAISQGFDKCTKLHCRPTIFEELVPMTATDLKYDHDIFIIKSAEILKLFCYEEVAGGSILTELC